MIKGKKVAVNLCQLERPVGDKTRGKIYAMHPGLIGDRPRTGLGPRVKRSGLIYAHVSARPFLNGRLGIFPINEVEVA